MENIVNDVTTNTNTIRYRVKYNAAASKMASRDIYSGQTEVKETYTLARVAKRMVERGCAANKSTIRLVLTDFADLVSDLVAEGYAVNVSGLVRFAPSIRGAFASPDAPWDGSVNRVVVNATVGGRMRRAAAQSTATRLNTVVLPTLTGVVDFATQTVGVITSEGAFLVNGTQLIWDTLAEDEGFFINVGGEERKCTLSGEATDPNSVILKTSQIFEQAGQEIELFFRTRIEDTLYQVKYDGTITTAVNG